ncbi:hypothetical protein LTR82_012990 [Friedmanniomyces endolithicus]|uniref:Uncharacterized protein n=1 Tax=Friedmanniomyces endolithicus TaxID=329885 RepID=A0AAN6J4N1_9PEZI|nr:hypothetical protein LTR82_012990 [Friedmanniomyces endolithicus]
MTALNSQVANGMALWPLSLARPQSRRKAKSRAGASPSGKITLDLDNLEVISSAAERVQAWRHQIVSAEGISLVETEPEIDLHHAAREVRIAAQGLGIEEKSVRAEKEQPLRTDTQDATRQPTVDARAARLAGKVERKHAEAELRRVAAEQRKTSEETANLVLALEVQERLFRIESLETEATLRVATLARLVQLAEEALERTIVREADAAAEVARLDEERKQNRRRRECEAEAEAARLFEEADQQRQRREAEAAAEAARVSEKEDKRRRRREAEAARIAAKADRKERRARAAAEQRRARLRDCAVCLDQYDLAEMIQLTCRHWYCNGHLRESARR